MRAKLCWPSKASRNNRHRGNRLLPCDENEMRKGYPVIMTASVYCIFSKPRQDQCVQIVGNRKTRAAAVVCKRIQIGNFGW